MARQIYIVNATQVVTSQAHPEGIYSVLPDYPKLFDSRNYNATNEYPNGDDAKALAMAKSEFHSRLSAFEAADNRAMWTVTLEQANGKQLMQESYGSFPFIMPVLEESDDIEN